MEEVMIDHDEPIGVQCPGCDVELTINNAGGYQCFCQKCVDAMPPFPKAPHIGSDLLDGELPSKRQIARLVSDGVSVAAIASAAGVAQDVIEKILED
jgi:hypothetical protein